MPFLSPASYLFLTTKPMVRMLDTRQLEWLYILPLVDMDPATLNVLITYTDTSTATANIDLTELRAYEVKMVDVSFGTRAWQNVTAAKTIKKIEVWIEIVDETGDRITYVPWTPGTDNFKQILYMNSLGGMDSFTCIGDGQGAYEFTGEVAVRQVDNYYMTEAGQEHAVNRRVRQTFTVQSGYKPKLEVKAMADMLLVNRMSVVEYWTGEAKLVPILVNMQGMSLPNDLANLNSFDFQYRYAWTDRALDRS